MNGSPPSRKQDAKRFICPELDELTAGATLRAVLPDSDVSVVNVQWFGSDALQLTYESPTGQLANETPLSFRTSRVYRRTQTRCRSPVSVDVTRSISRQTFNR